VPSPHQRWRTRSFKHSIPFIFPIFFLGLYAQMTPIKHFLKLYGANNTRKTLPNHHHPTPILTTTQSTITHSNLARFLRILDLKYLEILRIWASNKITIRVFLRVLATTRSPQPFLGYSAIFALFLSIFYTRHPFSTPTNSIPSLPKPSVVVFLLISTTFLDPPSIFQ
jgi:hypothetical protein